MAASFRSRDLVMVVVVVAIRTSFLLFVVEVVWTHTTELYWCSYPYARTSGAAHPCSGTLGAVSILVNVCSFWGLL